MSRKSHPLSGYARTLTVGSRQYRYFSLQAAAEAGLGDISRLPRSLKILLENLLCFTHGQTVNAWGA
jgi:aconitate hydratase